MKQMSIDKKKIMWAVLLIAAVQMPNLALSPSIHQINTVAFPNSSLALVQTVMQMPNIISPVVSLLTALLISRGIVSKKTVIVSGLFLVGFTGILSLLAHSQFWHLWLLSCCLGLGLSGFVSTASSLIYDYFNSDERRMISGYQTSFINGGGILLSLCGGVLASLCWYGGYLMLMLALPVGLYAAYAIPNRKAAVPAKSEPGSKTRRTGLHTDVFMFGGFIFVLMMVYNVIGSNISTHISKMGNSTVAGYTMAVQMAGGAICGIFFGKLSKKIGEFTSCLAFAAVGICMMLLSFFPSSLPVTFIAVFIGGTALSLMMPTIIFSVSKVTDETTSALATAITSCICPGLGSFLSAVVFTNLTTKLYGDSTAMRYRFVGCVALVCAAAVFAIITIRTRRAKKNAVPEA